MLLLFRYFRCFIDYFRVHMLVLILVSDAFVFRILGAIGGVYSRIDNDQWCLYVGANVLR